MTAPPPRHRRLLRASPEVAVRLLAQRPETALWVGPHPPSGVPAVPPRRLHQWLGRELDQLAFDARAELDVNALAMALGMVRGGGVVLLITPDLEHWPKLHGNSLFLQRLCRFIETLDRADPTPPAVRVAAPPGKSPFRLNPDQQRARQALLRVARGHPRRPLLITADRGRGKSALLGRVAGELLQQEPKRILVTAPRPDALTILFRHARATLPHASGPAHRLEWGAGRLEYRPPDALLRETPRCDLLLVDEAAGIPLPLLEQLVRRYNRIALTTTVHGYEGSGRGFALRLGRRLDRIRPGWRRLELERPVRWDPGDPVEAFGRRALLLDAEPDTAPVQAPERPRLMVLERRQLLENEALLRHLFGLLVCAHYRTEPRDLQTLLDLPGLELLALTDHDRLLAVAWVAREGALPEATIQAVRQGRRPRGHLLPQVLASRCGLPEALHWPCRRVVRIAVHPALQGRGLGSRLLSGVIQQARRSGAPLVGASFGATAPLVRFWQRQGFIPLRLGHRREASSGCHAVVMALGLDATARARVAAAGHAFQERFVLQLGDPFQSLDAKLALTLMDGSGAPRPPHRATLAAFGGADLPWLDALPALHALAARAHDPRDPDHRLLVLKLLQRRTWTETARQLHLPGRKAVEARLRAVAVRHA